MFTFIYGKIKDEDKIKDKVKYVYLYLWQNQRRRQKQRESKICLPMYMTKSLMPSLWVQLSLFRLRCGFGVVNNVHKSNIPKLDATIFF